MITGVSYKHNDHKYVVWAVVVGLSLFLSGCASLKEMAKGIAGTSTKELERGRAAAISQEFPLDYFTCFAKTKDALKGMQSYIYAGNIKQHMLAIYMTTTDTTPVGIFFTEKGKNSTMIEVSSPSTYGKEFISKKLFTSLSGKPVSKEAEAKSGVKQEFTLP